MNERIKELLKQASKLANTEDAKDFDRNFDMIVAEKFAELVRADERARIAEQPAQQEPYCYTYIENGEEYFAPVNDAYLPDDAEPLYTSPPAQQEPVAKSLLVSLYTTGYKDGHHDTVEGQYIDVHQSEMDTYHLDVVANWLEDNLIAQRTWVGLTEEERSKIESEVLMRGENYPEVLAAIEAKLKEKNT